MEIGIERIIMDDIASDPLINATDIGVQATKKKLFVKRQTISVFGVVRSEDQREKVIRIVERHAGDRFDVSSEDLKVKKS